jgi:hypothetical protein
MLKGEAALKAKLAALEVRMAAAAVPAEEAGAQMVARQMAATAPVDTGKLASSVGVSGSSAVATAPYAVYAPPFAAAAAHQAEPAVVAAMTAVIKTAVRSI